MKISVSFCRKTLVSALLFSVLLVSSSVIIHAQLQSDKPKSITSVVPVNEKNSLQLNKDEKLLASNSQPDWLLENSVSPVKITLSKRQNHLFFLNVSSKEISEISTGLVTSEKKKYTILSEAFPVKINGKLLSGEVQFAGVVDYAKDIDYAIERKVKLAVLRVKFSDGSSWQINSKEIKK